MEDGDVERVSGRPSAVDVAPHGIVSSMPLLNELAVRNTIRSDRAMAKKKTAFQVRQGDVMIERIDSVPPGLQLRPRTNGRVILAEGEATGHFHAIDDTETQPAAAIFDDPTASDGSFVLRVESATGLVHEEHARIDLPAGDYRVTRQREYSPEAIRQVAD